MPTHHFIGQPAGRFLAVVMAVALAGCLDFSSSNSGPDKPLQAVVLERKGDQKQPEPSIDLAKAVFEEWPTDFRLVFHLAGAPNHTYGSYECYASRNGTDEILQFALITGNKVGVRDTMETGSVLTLVVDYASVSSLTWVSDWDLYCLARGRLQSGQAPNKIMITTETTTIHWVTMRQLGDRDAALGVGPFQTATKVSDDVCCDVARNLPSEGTRVTTVDDPANDARELWMWQDVGALHLRLKFGAQPRNQAHVTCSYDPAPSPSQAEDPSVDYDYGSGRAWKQPGNSNVSSAKPVSDTLEFAIDWPHLEDRRSPDYVMFFCTILSSDEQGYTFVDSIEMPSYHVK